jgi:hypothetical protein
LGGINMGMNINIRRIITKEDVNPEYEKLSEIYSNTLRPLLEEANLSYGRWPWRRIKELNITDDFIAYSEEKKFLGLIPYNDGRVVADIVSFIGEKTGLEIRVIDSKFNDTLKTVATKLETKLEGKYIVKVSDYKKR